MHASQKESLRGCPNPLSSESTSARLSNNIPAMATKPRCAAQCSGVVPLWKATLTFKSEIQKQINVLSILQIGIGASIKKKRNFGVAALHNSQVQQCITTAKFVKCLNMKSPSETRPSGNGSAYSEFLAFTSAPSSSHAFRDGSPF